MFDFTEIFTLNILNIMFTLKAIVKTSATLLV